MKIRELTYHLINLGVTEGQTIEVSSRLKIINKFNLLCILYSIPYILFSISLNFLQPALVFFAGQLFYVFSLICNKRGNYLVAKFLILIATNFSVFYLSLFYGFDSGFHLYYFTSPLIVFSLFNFSELLKIIVGILLYLVTVGFLIFFNHFGYFEYHLMPQNITEALYSINVFLALSFCLLLVTHFSSFNKKINQVLARNNAELEKKQELLEAEIIERKTTELKLQTLLKDKETLLSETHHRVKNNLAVVSGMLDLQALLTEDEKLRLVLNDSRNRIKSMSLIHESLYKFDNVSQIEFGRYIKTLSEEIKQSYNTGVCNINMNYFLEEVNLSVTKAIPCGLLVNEVLTNSLKHAFSGKQEGRIDITLKKDRNLCILEISDDGNGMDPNKQKSSKSIGMTLIAAFVKQLKGKYEFVNNKGTTLKLIFETE